MKIFENEVVTITRDDKLKKYVVEMAGTKYDWEEPKKYFANIDQAFSFAYDKLEDANHHTEAKQVREAQEENKKDSKPNKHWYFR